MAGMGGLFTGLSEGLLVGDRLLNSAAQRKNAELHQQETQLRLEDQQRERADSDQARSMLSFEMGGGQAAQPTVPQEAAPAPESWDQAPVQPAAKPRMFDAYERAAQSLIAGGNMAKGEQFLKAADSLRSRHIASVADRAARVGGDEGLNMLLRTYDEDVPDGMKSSVTRDPNGGVVLNRFRADGTPVGEPQRFKDGNEAFQFLHSAATAPGLAAYLSDSRKQGREDRKADASINKDNADAGFTGAKTEGQKTENQLKVQFGAADAQAGIAQKSGAAANSYAGANLHNAQAGQVGKTPEMINWNFRASLTPEQKADYDANRKAMNPATVSDPTVVAAQKALIDAYTDPMKKGSMTPDQIAMAEQLLGRASDPALLNKGTGRGFGPRPENLPGAKTAKPGGAFVYDPATRSLVQAK